MSEYTKECLYCKMEFKTQNRDKLYCSDKHARIAQQLRWRMNPENKIKNGNYQKEKILEIRKKVYSILGNKCVKCGITDFDVLSIDHIEPIGKDRIATTTTYYQIIRLPEEAIKHYQLLCRNCNWKKRIENNENGSIERNEIHEYQIQAMYAELRSDIDYIKNKLDIGNKVINNYIHSNLSLDELAKIAYPLRESYIINDHINVNKLILILLKENVTIGFNNAYKLRAFLEMNYPRDFSKFVRMQEREHEREKMKRKKENEL